MSIPRFLNQIAVVTGGGSGIGRAVALRLASEAAEVYILELSHKAAEETQALIQKAGGIAHVIEADVSNTESVRNAFSGLSRLDILVNNAGIAHIGNVLQTAPEDLDRLYNINVRGVYHCLHFGIPLMQTNGSGSIVNLASIASKVGISDRFAYSMSKGAILAMTLSVAKDFVKKGIRCNCISPARVHTPFVDGFLNKHYPGQQQEMFHKLSQTQPIGRMGKPDEIASLAFYLCSQQASFITGCDYPIDGGFLRLNS